MNNIRKVIDNFTINRKTLGAFYTPTFLADYLARETMSLSTIDEDISYTIFDPAMGEGSLLLSCVSYATKKIYLLISIVRYFLGIKAKRLCAASQRVL